jgi:hypothetical protein
MNWRRGLIRCWIVASVLWAVPIGWLTWSDGVTYFLRYAYTAAIDPGYRQRALDVWRVKVEENARPWHETKARIRTNHGLEPPNSGTLGDLSVLDGGAASHHWWEAPDFCATEFNGIATPAECDELKRVAAAIPVLPMPTEAEEWPATSLLEWAGPVLIPPIALLLISAALTWAFRGFRHT